jgi:hypothetical protein
MSRTASSGHFEIEPPGSGARIWVWLLSVALPMLVAGTGLGFSLGRAGAAQAASINLTLVFALGALMFSILLTVAFWLQLAMRRNEVKLENGVLVLRAAWYRHRVAVADLDLSGSRVVSLDERTELRPLLKSNGYALPGYSAGHFRMRKLSRKAFCILTTRERVLLLKERSGHVILLSLRQPRTLLEALQRAAA